MTAEIKKYLDFTSQPDFQKILTNPILDIAARFWEDDRYEAFKVCYRSMRIIDDMVDDRKASGLKLNENEKQQYTNIILDWLHSFNEKKDSDNFLNELLETIDKFKMPHWPWQRLSKAMIYDINNEGFPNFLTFLRYTEGAAIAPR